jgi:hypothetical protein
VDEMEGVAKKGKKARKGRVAKAGASPSKVRFTLLAFPPSKEADSIPLRFSEFQGSKPASLFGGKAFAYERMIAIYESILDDRREYSIGSVAVAGQVRPSQAP